MAAPIVHPEPKHDPLMRVELLAELRVLVKRAEQAGEIGLSFDLDETLLHYENRWEK